MALHREISPLDSEPSRPDATRRDAPAGGVNRRRVLVSAAGVGALGLAGPLLVACGGGGTTTPEAQDTSSDPAQTNGADVIATTEQVPEGGGLILSDQKIVITQ